MREMKPAIAARTIATPKRSPGRGAFAAYVAPPSPEAPAAVARPRHLKCITRTAPATSVFNAAATSTEPDIPRYRIVTSAAAKHATAEPSVFTKYSAPTD